MFIIHEIFFTTRTVLKIGEYHSDILQGNIYQVTRLNRSREGGGGGEGGRKYLINNYSSRPHGLRPKAEWSIDSEPMRARGIIVLVKSN